MDAQQTTSEGVEGSSGKQETMPQGRDDSDAEDSDDYSNMPDDERSYLQSVKREAAACLQMDDDGGVVGANTALCAYAGKVVGNVCGDITDICVGRKTSLSIDKKNAPYGVQERTAVEVEYVESLGRKADADAKSEVSTSSASPKKSAMLKAIAKRAQDDFAKKQISTGEDPAAESELVEEDSSPQASKSRLAFWKKSKGKKTEEKEEDPEDERFAKSGINYYDAVRKDQSEYEIDEADDIGDQKKSKSRSRLAKFVKKGFTPLASVRDSSPRRRRSSPSKTPKTADQQVLRPIPVKARTSLSEEKKEEITKDDVDHMEERLKSQILGSSPASQTTTRVDMDMDLDMTTYLNSTEVMSNYGGSTVHDHLSVVSGKSYKTTGTTGTNYTTSTRSRRPGVAKHRIAVEKTKEKTPNKAGWQESIEAAAAQTGRVWDPEKGWIDYIDPNDLVAETEMQSDSEKIHIPLDSLKRGQLGFPEQPHLDANGEPVKVPFPSQWKKERSAMLEGGSESQEWVDSMKAATAKMKKDGKQWDPERGWVGPDNKGIASPGRYDNGLISVKHESDTQDFGMADSESGRYMQIGDSGSVNSHYGVRSRSTTPSGLKNVPVSTGEGSVRRGTGPVDLDETPDEVFGTGNKSIPKLKGSEKDTSPVRGRRASQNKEREPDSASSGRDKQTPQEGSSPSRGREATESEKSSKVRSPPKWLSPREDDPAVFSEVESSVSVSSVKAKARYWERRASESSPQELGQNGEFVAVPTRRASESTAQELGKNSEWKTFLARKVRGETPTGAKGGGAGEDDRDSLFDFPTSEGAFPTAPISNLSPIRKRGEYDDEGAPSEVAPSESSSIAVQPTSFLERLQACAAPITTKATACAAPIATKATECAAPIIPRNKEGEATCDATSMPLAHLNFMKTNPAVSGQSPRKSKFVPPNLCGRPDIIQEEEEDEEEISAVKESESPKKSKSIPLPSSLSKKSDDVSSVISDQAFGAKSAYLESIAMKAAVSSGSKRSKRKSRSGSDVSSSTSRHSDKWQKFLEKKASPSATSPRDGDVSKAAQKYASDRVDEMMQTMAKRSPSDSFKSRPMEEATGGFPVVGSKSATPRSQPKSKTALAAEDLAAARVEAMMKALSSKKLDEGEI